MLTRLGQRIDKAMPGRIHPFFDLTQDALGYIVPGDEWEIGRNQNKEEKVSLGKGAGQAIETALRELATR
ncbi:MAG: hypothetical protein ACM3TT_04305 [Syntrophothermus sp.]